MQLAHKSEAQEVASVQCLGHPASAYERQDNRTRALIQVFEAVSAGFIANQQAEGGVSAA
jgi:hypothetical protein